MNMPRLFVVLACVLFVLFLVSPTLVDSIDGYGRVTMLPGFAVVLWHLVCFPNVFGNNSGEWLALGSLMVVHLAAVAFPLLYLAGAFRRRWLSLFFGALFLLSLIPVGWLIHGSSYVGLGAYAWLSSLLCAAFCCLVLFRPTAIV